MGRERMLWEGLEREAAGLSGGAPLSGRVRICVPPACTVLAGGGILLPGSGAGLSGPGGREG